MAYSPTNFVNDVTPFNADEANKMSTGIDQVHNFMDVFSGNQAPPVTAGFAWFSDGSVYVARQQLSTDNPGVFRATVSATSYAWVAADQGKLRHFTAATAIAVTIPTGLVTIADAVFGWRQYGAGQITWTSGGTGNAIINSRGGALKSAGQYAEGTLTRVGSTDEYILSGDITV